MKLYVLFFLLAITVGATSQSKDEIAIRKILSDQNNAWNEGKIDEFMKGYWQNDSLMFIGKNGVTYGWDKTLNNYKKSYPDTTAMGKLTFNILKVKMISEEYYFVLGKWFLKRIIGDLSGHFTLLFQKIENNWVIIADHSS